MNFQSKLLATGLLALSACGTMALFGSVPTVARLLSPDDPLAPLQSQVSEQAQLQARRVQAELYAKNAERLQLLGASRRSSAKTF
ncbi:MAG: hypothetical protein HC827_19585 [Cyanobacteria bacterium RM1_2_2]|nr:hypothetical protein [Cyanobacteria bacterium RM1_2_2]